jgi:hypothetical protein
MDVVTMAVVAVACAGAAFWFFSKASGLQDGVQAAEADAESAKNEARKNADRADQFRKKYEAVRESTADNEKAAKTAKKKANDFKSEVKKLRSELDSTSADAKKLDRRARRAEQEAAELRALVDDRPTKRKKRAPEPEPVERVVEVRKPTDDPTKQLRIAELEAKKEERRLEFERLQNERETMRNERLTVEERAELEELRGSSGKLYTQVFEREQELRIAQRKLEQNRRAYIVTAKQLELLEEELFRVKNGTERPEDDKPLATPEELIIQLAAKEAAKAGPKKKKPKKAPAAAKKAPAAKPAAATKTSTDDGPAKVAAPAQDDAPTQAATPTVQAKDAQSPATQSASSKPKRRRSKSVIAAAPAADSAKSDDKMSIAIDAAAAKAAPVDGEKKTVRRRRKVGGGGPAIG